MSKHDVKDSTGALEGRDENHWDVPPAYSIDTSGSVLASSASINEFGGVDIDFKTSEPKALEELLQSIPSNDEAPPTYDVAVPARVPSLNIVIQVVGSRGDVQPFVALGNALQRYGHRVRLATHDVFASFVRDAGLEFYPIGGDPEDLMAYMVKNPGLIPSMESLRGGDIGRKRKMIHTMLRGCWASCVEPDPISQRPFVADAIIANPPSFAHVHCAEALSVPLHIMFTMPWSATRAFPHPLANVKAENMDPKTSNYLSYGVVDFMTWQGLGDVINDWRKSCLRLEPLAALVGPDIVSILKIPQTYCWSPALVPKPIDWPDNIDVCGFFMRAEPSYSPPQELADWLQRGPEPVYVGFGSIVIDDPASVTDLITEASRRLGIRVIISRGWSKLGGSDSSTDDIFYLEDCPHEWLFKHVAAVVHHGGAGTTACGLLNGQPTTIVPFFGDQPFWGSVVASNGAGPAPIPFKKLTAEALTEAISFCLQSSTKRSAVNIAAKMQQENGVETAVKSFHSHLPWDKLACDALPDATARWRYRSPSGKARDRSIGLSNEALQILIQRKKLNMSDVRPLRTADYAVENKRWDPVTAGASSALGTVTDFTSALGGTFIDPYKEVKRVRAGGSQESASLAAMKGVGRGMGNMGVALTKSTLVDLPLALTEGLRNAPGLLGDDVRDNGRVTDWKSGGVVAGKNFGLGLYDGMVGFVKKPLEGAKEGPGGVLKGIGLGTVGLVTKPGSAMVGILAYPAQGIYKSVRSLGNPASKAIDDAKQSSLKDATISHIPESTYEKVVWNFEN